MIDGVTASRSWLVPFLLLSLRGGDAYGRELTEDIGSVGFEGTRPGEVYRVLREMEEEGIVASFREGGKISPLERRYGITSAGEAYPELWANSLERYRDETYLFLRAYAGRSGGDRP